MEQAEKVTEERSGSKPHDKKETAFPALLAHFFSLHAPSKQGNVAAILKRYKLCVTAASSTPRSTPRPSPDQSLVPD